MTTQSHDDDMPGEIDFSDGTRGKFYRKDAQLQLPIHLEASVHVNAHSKLTLFATSKIDPLSSGVNINAQISSYDSSCGFVFNHVKVTPLTLFLQTITLPLDIDDGGFM